MKEGITHPHGAQNNRWPGAEGTEPGPGPGTVYPEHTRQHPGALVGMPGSLCIRLKTVYRGMDGHKGDPGQTFQKAQKGKHGSSVQVGELSSPSHYCAAEHLTLHRGEQNTAWQGLGLVRGSPTGTGLKGSG